MSPERTSKHKTSFALTPEAERLLNALAKKMGLTRVGVLETVLREKGKAEQLVEEKEAAP
jgi:hypothetical protein